MKVGPDIAPIAALVGDPARASMLSVLSNGRALTATELAQEGGVTIQTASSHLSKLVAGNLLVVNKQGRHRYYRLKGPEVAAMLESLMGLAADAGHMRVRTGPKDPALRRARVCYDHLAGDLSVDLFDRLVTRKILRLSKTDNGADDSVMLSGKGRAYFADLGIDLEALAGKRRPLCKACLDWSVRRNHLAGGLGAALLNHFYERKLARREPESRIVTLSARGEKKLAAMIAGQD